MYGGSSAPSGDAKQVRLRRQILTSSKGLLDPPVAGLSQDKLSHDEVLEVGKKGAADFARLVKTAFGI